MTVLRQRMTEDMQVRNLSPHTQTSYLQQVALFARYLRTSPDALTPEHIRTYQIHLTNEKKLAPNSIPTLEAEIWILRQQINVLRRTAPKKQTFSSIDRLIFVGLYRLRPSVRDALAIVKPETVVKWHRAGFRLYWRWKSKARGGRPTIPSEIRRLVHEMSIANPLWGAPRIHGELLKLGVDIRQTSVAK